MPQCPMAADANAYDGDLLCTGVRWRVGRSLFPICPNVFVSSYSSLVLDLVYVIDRPHNSLQTGGRLAVINHFSGPG